MDKNKIKIACVGNMNNTMFALVRHLIYRGYNAEIVLLGDEDHFQPESDTYEIEKYTKIIKKVNWLDKDILSFDSNEVKSFLQQYDYIICAGIVMAYLNYAGVVVDLFIPYGGDFFVVPFDYNLNNTSKYNRAVSKAMAVNQTQAIKKSKSILWDVTNSEFEKIIRLFNIDSKIINCSSPFLYSNDFNYKNIEKFYNQSQTLKIIEELKLKYDCLIFNHIRQCWINPPDQFSYKGNDTIFKAFARLLKSNTNINPLLIVFDYGQDVENSKKLVKELGIENNVYWFQKSTRKEILTMISKIDIGIGEIGDHSWFSYGSVYEFLTMAKPVIHHRDDSLYENKMPSLYPMFSVKTEEDIYNHLISYYKNKQHFIDVGIKAHEWYIKNSINKSLDIIEKQIALSTNLNYRFSKKLVEILSSITPLRFLKRVKLYFSLKSKLIFSKK